MNHAEWKKKRSQPVKMTTPTGLELELKDYTLLDMIVDGSIPSNLEPEVDRILKGEPTNTKGLGTIVELSKVLAKKAILSPDGLDVNEIPVGDLIWIFRQTTGAAVAQITGMGTPSDR